MAELGGGRPVLHSLIVFLFVFWISHKADGQRVRIETKAGQTFDAVCPTKHYVSRIRLTREAIAATNATDFRFLVECDSFEANPDTDTGTESCQVLLPIPILFYDLEWNDYERNCDCNEYLAGIRSEHFGEKWDGPLAGRERRIQLVCCRADNRRLDGDRCGYTGHESLFAPWREIEVGTARFTGGKQRGVIQSLFFSGGYMNSRICAWEDTPLGRNGDFDEANGCYERWSCHRNAGKGNCYDKSIEQFGWTEPLMYFDTTGVASYTKSEPYTRQEHICRTGQRVVSVRTVVKNSSPPDFGLFVGCSSIGSVFPCFCYWMSRCADVDTWYVAGVRSYWDKTSQQRQLESLCCKTNGFRANTCRDATSIDDKKNSITLNSKLALNGGGETVEFVRNIATVDGGAQASSLRFNICTGVQTYDWCADGYDDPCYTCSRKQSDEPIARTLPAPRPPPITSASGSQSSNGIWQSTQYTGRDSSGWGDVWFTRPIYTRTVIHTVHQPPVIVVAPPACKPGPRNGYHDPRAGGWVNHHHGGGSSSHGGTKSGTGGGGGKSDGHHGDGGSKGGGHDGHHSHEHGTGAGGSNGHGGKSGDDGHTNGGKSGHSDGHGGKSGHDSHSNGGGSNNGHGGKSGHDSHSNGGGSSNNGHGGGKTGQDGHSNGAGSSSNSGSTQGGKSGHSGSSNSGGTHGSSDHSSSSSNGHSSSSSSSNGETHSSSSNSNSHSNGGGRTISEYHGDGSSHSGHSFHSESHGGSRSVSGGSHGGTHTSGGANAGGGTHTGGSHTGGSHGGSVGGSHGGSVGGSHGGSHGGSVGGSHGGSHGGSVGGSHGGGGGHAGGGGGHGGGGGGHGGGGGGGHGGGDGGHGGGGGGHGGGGGGHGGHG